MGIGLPVVNAPVGGDAGIATATQVATAHEAVRAVAAGVDVSSRHSERAARG